VVAKVRPRHLLGGKLIGLGVVNLLQLVVLVVVALIAVALSPDLFIPEGLLGASGMIALSFSR
jgi:ABC-type Na+ efflux pump permease subunit